MCKRMWPVAALVMLLSLGGGLAARAAGTTVTMVDGSGDPTTTWKFDPADVTVSAGSTVTWQNKGQQPHTITADDGSFTSDYISPGATWQHTFATAGTYAYHCTPHPWMKGVVHVTGGPAPAGGASPAPAPATQAGAPPASTSTTATTARTAAAASSSTTTTAAAGAPTTSTTAAASGGTTTTTAVAASTGGAGSSASPENNSTTTTTPGEHQAASSRGGSHGGKTDAPQAALAGILTVLLAALTLRLLSAKS